MKRFFFSILFLCVFSIVNSQAVNLNIKVMLEGPFDIDQMSNMLNTGGFLPDDQPYNTNPWNYFGDETVSSLPSNIVDWVLVEVLADISGDSSMVFVVKGRKAGLLSSNGKITAMDGVSLLTVETPLSSFYVRVTHRNHLPVTSSMQLEDDAGIYSWDFTLSSEYSLEGLNTLKEMNSGKWAIKGADGDGSYHIDNNDKNEVWLPEFNQSGYSNADFNMDGVVDSQDISNMWAINTGSGSEDFIAPRVLTVCDENGRYFCKGDEAVFLTGSHTWDNFQDIGIPFIYEDYIDWLVGLNHNFIRLWVWETPKGTNWAKDNDHDISPDVYMKIGNQYDLGELNQAFFERLQERIQLAADNDIYVSVMLFQGFSAEHDPVAWNYHPYKGGNNINGVSAAPNEVHTNIDPEIVAAQQMYIRKVVDLVNSNGFDNVLYEIGNEIEYSIESDSWHNDMIGYIHDYELNTYGLNRPVGKTFQYQNGSNEFLFNSPADWISPNSEGGFDCREGDAPIATGDKVIISDSDHFYFEWYSGDGHPVDLVWKSFTGGINICHMDNWGGGDNEAGRLLGWPSAFTYDVVRNNMGYARELSESIKLLPMLPQPQLSSTGFCIASQEEYVIYLPEAVSQAIVDLSFSEGQFSVEWLDCSTGSISTSIDISAGGSHSFSSPHSEYSILILRKKNL